MNIIVLGDKFQKRMKSKGCVGLIRLNNKNIIQHQHKVLRQIFPSSNIIYVYGFENKRFQSFINKNSILNNDIEIIYNPNYEQFNNAYSLYLASSFLNNDCLIMFGDTIISKKTFDKFTTNKSSQIFVSKKHKGRLGCIINESGVENIAYDLNNYIIDMYYLSTKHTSMIKDILENKINHNCFIFEIINKLIDAGQNIYPFFSEHTSFSLITNKA